MSSSCWAQSFWSCRIGARASTTNQPGHYEFSALAPGKHKLFAWDNVKPNAWNDPAFLKDYENQAEKVAIKPAKATFYLHIVVPPDAR